MTDSPNLDGWNIGHAADVEWQPWGSNGNARAKVLAAGDGYYIAVVEADPGYRGDHHVHEHTEFSVVLDGSFLTQGIELGAGDAYVAEAGSVHSDFEAPRGARYVSIFKI